MFYYTLFLTALQFTYRVFALFAKKVALVHINTTFCLWFKHKCPVICSVYRHKVGLFLLLKKLLHMYSQLLHTWSYKLEAKGNMLVYKGKRIFPYRKFWTMNNGKKVFLYLWMLSFNWLLKNDLWFFSSDNQKGTCYKIVHIILLRLKKEEESIYDISWNMQ